MSDDKRNENNEVKDEVTTTKKFEKVNDVSEETDDVVTKEVVKIEDASLEDENEIETSIGKVSEEDVESKDSNKKKKIIAIVLVVVVFILFAILIFVLNKDREKKNEEKADDGDITDIVLTEEDKKQAVRKYGEALENVILTTFQNENKILTFEEASKLITEKEDVVCSKYEIYEDGKLYLEACSVNGKVTDYTYGVKQSPKENFDASTMLKVYVNKITNERYLTIPNNNSNIDEYLVHLNGTYENPTILGDSDYVFYYDSEYNVQMKNFKTDKKALEGIKYSSIVPFRINDMYFDTKYVSIYNGNKWAIYDLETSKAVISYIYDVITPLSGGVTGPALAQVTLKDTTIAVSKNGKYGIVDYTTGKEVVPIDYDTLLRSGNYLWAEDRDNRKNYIYDFSGNTYLTDGYDKLYGISEGTYVLVEKDKKMALIQMDGKVLYEYGDADKLAGLNFALKYKDDILFQLYKDDTGTKCIEYSYNPGSKTGESKDIECGGLAKPILYLYPKEKTKVTVNFAHPEFLETTYPKFNGGWKVQALPNGDLYDEDDNYYYALYWDEKKIHEVDFSEGYYVEAKNAINFLEEKLEYIGLNDRERNEFIMYWLPVLEKNEKSLVYFELTEERESYNKLLIEPKPDSVLRIVIHIKKVDKKQDIKKESLTKFNRRGFSVVEWGGTTY